MTFLWKRNNRGLLREGAGQEVENALKIRCREEKIGEVVLPQDCAKHRHKQMPVVAMFSFLHQPDHRTGWVTVKGKRRGCKEPAPISTVWYQQQHSPVLGEPRDSTGSPWRLDMNKQGKLLSHHWVKGTWSSSRACLVAWHLVLKPVLPICPGSQPDQEVFPFASGTFSTENL